MMGEEWVSHVIRAGFCHNPALLATFVVLVYVTRPFEHKATLSRLTLLSELAQYSMVHVPSGDQP